MTTKTDIYLLQGSSFPELMQFACKLCEKVYKAGNQLILVCMDRSQASLMDESLWSANASSFIPHKLANSPDKDYPVAITYFDELEQRPSRETENSADTVAMYLSPQIPTSEPMCGRRLFLVPNSPNDTGTARELYKQIKAKGFDIETHDMRRK